MSEETLWQLEEEFWTGDVETLRSRTADDAVMVFPFPDGILKGEAIFEGMAGTPRWSSVTISERQMSTGAEMAVLAYRADAIRDGAGPYSALCASTYIRDGSEWRLIAHQQTPVNDKPR